MPAIPALCTCGHELWLNEMAGCLGSERATATAVSDISEALAILEEGRPQVAVLDINIRGQFSYPVADRLHQLAIPIVFLTGYDVPAIHGHGADTPFARSRVSQTN